MKLSETNVKVTAVHNHTMNLPEIHMSVGRSTLRLVTRPEGDDPNGADANIMQATGVQKDIVMMLGALLKDFVSIKKVTNQVSNEKELRAMFRAGFRYTPPLAEPEPKLDGTLWYLKNRGSIMMVWERPGCYYLWNARTLTRYGKLFASEEEAQKSRRALPDEEADATYVKRCL